MKFAPPLTVAWLAACLVACGQKGPLVLPSAQHPHRKIVVPKAPVPGRPAADPNTPGVQTPATPAPPPTPQP